MRIPPQRSTPARIAVRERLKQRPITTPKPVPPSESWWVGLETVDAFYRRASIELDRMRLSRYGRLDAASCAVDRWSKPPRSAAVAEAIASQWDEVPDA